MALALPRCVATRSGPASTQSKRRGITNLRAILDSVADAVLVVGEDGAVLVTNRHFRTLWRMGSNAAVPGQEQLALAEALSLLVDPEPLTSALGRPGDPHEERSDTLRLKDGRTLQLFTRGLTMDGELLRVCSLPGTSQKRRGCGERTARHARGTRASSFKRGCKRQLWRHLASSIPSGCGRMAVRAFPTRVLRSRGYSVCGPRRSPRTLPPSGVWCTPTTSGGSTRASPSLPARFPCGSASSVPARRRVTTCGSAASPCRRANPDGSVLWHGFLSDVTQLKRTELRLEEEAIRRRVLFEHSTDGIVVMDSGGAVYELNQTFADMLGYPLDEASHLHVWDWDVQWDREELVKRIANDPKVTFETRHRRKDGSVYDAEIQQQRRGVAGPAAALLRLPRHHRAQTGPGPDQDPLRSPADLRMVQEDPG